MPPSSHRDPLSELFALFHLLQILAHFGVHVAGSNGVDIDAATAPLRGERHGQLFDAALAGDIRRHVPQADERIGGGDVDNFSLALFQHLSNDQFLYPLYQKISSLHVILAPLREFPDSITDFSQIFLTAANQEYQKSIRGFEEGVVALLEQQHWNTNLSQLKTFIQQLVLTAQGAQITLKEAQTLLLNDNTIPPEETEYLNYSGIDITKPLEEIERDIIQHVLMEENMNQSAAARRLGISRNTIWRKLHA